jgi:hypothetical protein
MSAFICAICDAHLDSDFVVCHEYVDNKLACEGCLEELPENTDD